MCTQPASVSTTHVRHKSLTKHTATCGGGSVDIYITFKTHTLTVQFEIVVHKCAHDAKRDRCSATAQKRKSPTLCNVHKAAPNWGDEKNTDRHCAN